MPISLCVAKALLYWWRQTYASKVYASHPSPSSLPPRRIIASPTTDLFSKSTLPTLRHLVDNDNPPPSKPMMEEFKAEVDVEKGGSFAATPEDVMPKPYFATIDRVTAYYNVRIRGEGGREGEKVGRLEGGMVGWCGRMCM